MPRNRTEIAADRRGCPCFLRERPPFRRSDPYPVAMSPEGLPPPPPPPPRDSRGPGRPFRGEQGMPKRGLWVLPGLPLMVVVLPSSIDNSSKADLSYYEFMAPGHNAEAN